MTGARKHYVAVVDDDDSVARAFARLLRSAGYEAITYPSAEAYLDDQHRPRFDCLVLDLQLAGITGLELCRRLSAVNDSTPVVLMTARDEMEDRVAAEACGCVGYFQKTALGADVLAAIEQAIQSGASPAAQSCARS